MSNILYRLQKINDGVKHTKTKMKEKEKKKTLGKKLGEHRYQICNKTLAN